MADDPWAKFNPQKPDSSTPASSGKTSSEESDEPGYLRQLGGGIVQGTVFDPVTGINQLIEHASNNKIGLPDSVKQWLNDYKEKYVSGTAGEIGEGIGTIGSLIIPGSIALKGASALGRGMGLIGRGASAAGEAVSSGAGALGRLARIVKTPPPAVPGLAGRAKAGAGEAAKAFRKGKQLEEPAAKAAASPAAATTERSVAERMAVGAAGGAAGGAVQPVDEEQGDYWKQKGAQTLAGGTLGGLLGTPQAAPMLATGLIGGAFKEFGPIPTAMALAGLWPTLRALAAHHNSTLMHAGGQAAGAVEKFIQRPGAAFAGGRAAAPFSGPAGADIWEQLDDNSK